MQCRDEIEKKHGLEMGKTRDTAGKRNNKQPMRTRDVLLAQGKLDGNGPFQREYAKRS